MDLVFFLSLSFLVSGWCIPISPYVYQYEPTELWDAMDIPPINFDEVSSEPWIVDDYTSWTYVDWSSTTSAATTVTTFTGDETEALREGTTTTATVQDHTRTLKVAGIKIPTTTVGTVFRDVIQALNKVTPTATSSTVIRNEIRVLSKVAQILILLGEKVIPHVIGNPSVFGKSCKRKKDINFIEENIFNY